MLGKLFSALKRKPGNDEFITRRRHPRRDCDRCVGMIAGKTYPVENWSMGGLQITGDDRMFTPGQTLDVTLKFKLRNNILDVAHKASVIRKGNGKIAFRFQPLTLKVTRSLQQVVDDYVAAQFAQSQLV
ncbi:MAG TPA: pilus assembly protein PilZ [Rhodospirillaceae bacterium]|nr:pilus assembly protein PilZ [Rhodospirillaceae bacterium]